MKRNLIVNSLFCVFSVFIILLVAEIIIGFSWEMGDWVKRPIYRKSANPYLRYELTPNSQSGKISINSQGFRGPEYPLVKPTHAFRILMIGDSETLSFMLPQDATLAAQLEKLLNQKSSDLRYEVLNFGVEGYCTLQELEQLKTKGLRYNPDLIMLNYCLNDPEPGEYYLNKTWLMRHSALVRYFTYRIKKTMIKRERKKLGISNELQNYTYYHQPKYFNLVKEAILEMAEISQKTEGRNLVVVIFPTSSIQVEDFKENYPYKKIHAQLKGIDTDKILFIDLIDEFNRLNLTPRQVSINYAYDESHKNAAALQVAANYIYRTLKSQGLIPD